MKKALMVFFKTSQVLCLILFTGVSFLIKQHRKGVLLASRKSLLDQDFSLGFKARGLTL